MSHSNINVVKSHCNVFTNLRQKAATAIEEKLQTYMTFCNATSFWSDVKKTRWIKYHRLTLLRHFATFVPIHINCGLEVEWNFLSFSLFYVFLTHLAVKFLSPLLSDTFSLSFFTVASFTQKALNLSIRKWCRKFSG